jgi:FtsH-binding integral membrane protein
MNGAQLHLALNHVPVVLSMAGLAVLLWGTVTKNADIKKVGFTLAILTAICAGAAYLTGEPAEDVLKKLPDYPRPFVHAHEDVAEIALIVSIIAGVFAAAALYLGKIKNKFSSLTGLITIALLVIASLAFLQTAHLGGLVVHKEIRD